MRIKDVVLPRPLVEALTRGDLQRRSGSWQLKSKQDAFGNPLETELGLVYDTQELIEQQTLRLNQYFQPSDYYRQCLPEFGGPGAIPIITDFSKIICFGMSADGAPFCLDYRNSPDRPSVIWWDDVYWRVVSPDFESFLSLFDLGSPEVSF